MLRHEPNLSWPMGPRLRRAATRALRSLVPLLVLLVVYRTSAEPPGAWPGEAPRLEAPHATQAVGSGWWSEHKQRFYALAVCALASADVSFLLLSGLSPVGAGLGVAAAALTILMCL